MKVNFAKKSEQNLSPIVSKKSALLFMTEFLGIPMPGKLFTDTRASLLGLMASLP